MQKNFYRKYRPKKFIDVYGQEKIIKILREQINRERTHFAYLFAGIHGIGKTSMARILSKSINCSDNEMGEACEKCRICILNDKKLVDIYEIDAASNNGVEQIRSLKEKSLISPAESKKKIYIIDEVHMLSKSAYNAFLKLLEEPPSHVIFILATTQLYKIPETILSRCQIFEFLPLSNEVLTNLLKKIAKKEGLFFEEEALELISKKTKGSVREALNILEQTSFFKTNKKITVLDLRSYFGMTNEENVNQFIISLLKKDEQTSFKIIENLEKNGVDFNFFLLEIIEKLIKIIFNKILEKKEEQENMFNFFDIKELKNILDIFVKRYSKFNVLNLVQVFKLIIFETNDFVKKSIINKNKNIYKEKKISISKCFQILKKRNKDVFEVVKINWNLISKNLDHDIFGKYAKLLNDSIIISVSYEGEILIKVMNKEIRNEINFIMDNEEFLNFIKKITGKKYQIFAIIEEEKKILKQNFEKQIKNEK